MHGQLLAADANNYNSNSQEYSLYNSYTPTAHTSFSINITTYYHKVDMYNDYSSRREDLYTIYYVQ